jgi:hypothetical protein
MNYGKFKYEAEYIRSHLNFSYRIILLEAAALELVNSSKVTEKTISVSDLVSHVVEDGMTFFGKKTRFLQV